MQWLMQPRSRGLSHVAIGHFRVLLCLCFKTSLSAKPFIWKWVLICILLYFHANQSHFHKNTFALRLVLNQRHKGTRKWPIDHKFSMGYLSNRPQVSMVYRLINHLGCWWNNLRIRKTLACGSWFTNSCRVLPTSRVVYQLITHSNSWCIV